MNKLVDQRNDTYYNSINKKHNADYFASTEKIETNHKAPNFKVNNRVKITKYTNIFSQSYTGNWSRDICYLFCFEKYPWTYKIKALNKETN